MTSPPPPSSGASPPRPGLSGLLAVVLIALLGATATAVAAGLKFDVPLALDLALQYALALTAAWAVRDAMHLRARRRTQGDDQTAETATADEERADGVQASAGDDGDRCEEDDVARREFDEARSMHCLFLATPAALIAFLAAFRLWTSGSLEPPTRDAGAAAIGLLMLGCLWRTLAAACQAVPRDVLPESAALGEALRESMWATLLAGGALWAGAALPPVLVWGERLILAWVLAAAVEQMLRAIARWQFSADEGEFLSPVALLLREAVLMRSNPVSSLFDVMEQRFGLSLRSTWALMFVRWAMRPAAVVLALFVWGVSGLVVIDAHQWGLREQFGRVVGDPLPPGLHASLPWPMERIRVLPVKTMFTMQIGFQDRQFSGRMERKKALLWTKAHDEEFSLVLGTGTELVAVNAVVFFKIAETRAALLDYVYHSQSPEAVLEACAYRVLMEETRSKSLEEVLSLDRAAFVGRVLTSLRDSAARERLGLDVVDVAVVNLHPPVEAAAAYLDTISAAIDADREGLEAHGRAAIEQQEAEQERQRLVNDSRIEADRRRAAASAETARFRAAREVYDQEGAAFQSRLVFDAVREMFSGKRLVLVDRELAAGAAEVLLDLRELTTPPSPAASAENGPLP